MIDISNNEIVELGMLAAILGLALVSFIRWRRKSVIERSKDDESSYFVG
jgi:hypothetical protein